MGLVSLAHYPGLGIAIKGMRIRLITLRLSSVVPSLIWFLPLLQTLVDLQSWQKLAYPDLAISSLRALIRFGHTGRYRRDLLPG